MSNVDNLKPEYQEVLKDCYANNPVPSRQVCADKIARALAEWNGAAEPNWADYALAHNLLDEYIVAKFKFTNSLAVLDPPPMPETIIEELA